MVFFDSRVEDAAGEFRIHGNEWVAEGDAVDERELFEQVVGPYLSNGDRLFRRVHGFSRLLFLLSREGQYNQLQYTLFCGYVYIGGLIFLCFANPMRIGIWVFLRFGPSSSGTLTVPKLIRKVFLRSIYFLSFFNFV